MAGWTESFGAGDGDFYLVKTNSLGDTLWAGTYGGSDWDEAYSVQQTADGGYIVAGHIALYSYPESPSDFYLVKTGPELPRVVISIQNENAVLNCRRRERRHTTSMGRLSHSFQGAC